MKTKAFIILSVAILLNFFGRAQYIQFSQYYATPTLLAPSFTGAIENTRINFAFRDQWTKIPGTFMTLSLGVDKNLTKINSGIGFLVVRDQAGDGNLARTDVGVLYSWYGLIDRTTGFYFRPGIQFKLSQRSIDFQQLIFPDQITPNGYPFTTNIPSPTNQQPPEFPNRFNLDATASLLFYNVSFWAGATVDHLFRPQDQFYRDYRLPLKYNFFGGYKFRIATKTARSYSSNKDFILISTYLRMQAGILQADLGAYWEHEPITIGLWLRGIPYLNPVKDPNFDAMIFLFAYQIDRFTIGYSYDFTISSLLAKTGGSHELTISYKFVSSLRTKRRDGPIPCPGI